MKTRAAIIALAASAVAGLAVAAPASAHDANYFSSCAKLNQVFPHGVSKSAAAASKQVRYGYGRPSTTSRAKKVYNENHARLDRDGDGTACER